MDVVQALVTANADVNAKTNDRGESALSVASLTGHLDVVRALLGAKANANAVDDAGATALMLAASGGHLDVVKALVAAGADIKPSGPGGLTALGVAARMGHQDVVQFLNEARR
jgi:ankyrin repeat protein